MKKLFAFIILVVVSTVSFGQITDIYPVKKDKATDSSIVINRIQASSLTGTNFSTDKLDYSGFTSLRVGIMGTYQPVKWFAFKTWGMVQLEKKIIHGDSSVFNLSGLQQAWVQWIPIKKLSIEMGYTSTVPTEQRPHPLDEGHFETGSQATIVGAAINTKVKYQITKNLEIAGGIAVRNKLPEYSTRIIYKKIKLSAWYAEWNKKFGSALTLDFSRVNSTLVWKQNQTLADIMVVKLGEAKNTLLYSDIIYDFQKEDLTRAEIGVLRCFDLEVTKKVHIKGLFGLGYEHNTLHFQNTHGTFNFYGYFHL